MEKTKKVIIEDDRCKGCQLCTQVCPVDIIKMADRINNNGHHPAEVTDQDKCISCGMCATMCPDLAITVYKEE